MPNVFSRLWPSAARSERASKAATPTVRMTRRGRLYVNADELFRSEKVQKTIRALAKSEDSSDSNTNANQQ